jgi:N-acetylneuraminic acid mutarotase
MLCFPTKPGRWRPAHLARRRAGVATLALLALAACTGDSFPTQPDAPLGDQPSRALPFGGGQANYIPDSWATKHAMPTARRGLVTATVNGVIYAIGGRSASEVNLGTVESYLPGVLQLNPWKTKAQMPAPRAWASGAAVINGKVYVPGGLNANATATRTLYQYNPATDEWTRKADMPIASYGGAAVTHNGKLWVLTPAGGSTRLHRYDPSTNKWTARASGPAGHYYPVAGVIDGKIYVAGTMKSDESPSHQVSVYDPASNSWSTGADMPEDQLGAGGGVVGGKLYLVGGFHTLNYGGVNYTTVYNPASDTWAEKAGMPKGPRGFLSVASVNGILYALGGLYTPNVLSTNEAYSP